MAVTNTGIVLRTITGVNDPAGGRMRAKKEKTEQGKVLLSVQNVMEEVQSNERGRERE